MSLQQAQQFIAEQLSENIVEQEIVSLPAALGRIAAEDIRSKEDLPPFSRSTVDGYAVRSADTFGAGETAPALFSVTGEVLMGQQTAFEILAGQAAVIPTGGMLPTGADTVVMVEYTEQPDPKTLLVFKPAAPGENLVAQGEDIKGQAIIVRQGQKIAPQHIGILAACGVTRLAVNRKLKVAVISTGDELVDIHEVPGNGQIRDVNSYTLAAMLEESGCFVERMGIVRDNYEQFFGWLQQAVTACQLVVISGGSSVGVRDYTVKAIGALGAPGVLFHGIAVKPGKPTIFGMTGAVPVFGLPGHPVAAMTVCEQLVKLAVRRLNGHKLFGEKLSVPAHLTRKIASAPGRDDFIHVKLSKQDGEFVATPIFGKSGLIRIMVQADGVVHIPENKSGLYEAERVEVVLTEGTR